MEKLTCKDFMVGDWIKMNNGYAKVVGLKECIFFSDKFETGISYSAEPIPLTTEILEKNGFEKSVDDDDQHNRYTLIIEHTSFSLKYARSVFQWITPIDIKYVHELQHILKFCGIYKEIEL